MIAVNLSQPVNHHQKIPMLFRRNGRKAPISAILILTLCFISLFVCSSCAAKGEEGPIGVWSASGLGVLEIDEYGNTDLEGEVLDASGTITVSAEAIIVDVSWEGGSITLAGEYEDKTEDEGLPMYKINSETRMTIDYVDGAYYALLFGPDAIKEGRVVFFVLEKAP
ncbi:MAG: hypothetical protein HFJ66_02910 [Eggerthellaceae bacterium]|nr:hypothetical protein [Eggerthellaceae bacterium]